MTAGKLAADVRAALAWAGVSSEVKMFGGVGFMLDGNMVAAVSKRGLLLRVGKDRYAQALARRGARHANARLAGARPRLR
jgi:TfoX/Sxy family transcriptional regulator of competence genes